MQNLKPPGKPILFQSNNYVIKKFKVTVDAIFYLKIKSKSYELIKGLPAILLEI